MERDFMGLNPKDCMDVKEELVEGGCEDSGIARIQWPLSSNVSAFSPFKSLKPEQDEISFKFLGGNSITPPASKASNSAAQLTIFYNGTVNVFDDISSEKVQAIIFLARNGCVSSNMAQRLSMSCQPMIDISAANSNTKLSNSPMMVPSLTVNSIMSSAIPQSRKASLARFLEKRRERVMNASPYKMSKKPNDCVPQEDSTCCAFSSNEISGN